MMKADVIARAQARLRNRKIGLVLAGGGAKGAYQIGCWKALRDAGLANFAAIAGSSVGALNAALISTNNFEKAFGLWSNLRRSQVIGLRTPLVVFFPVWLLFVCLRLMVPPSASTWPLYSMWVATWFIWGWGSSGKVVGALVLLEALNPLTRQVVLYFGPTSNRSLAIQLQNTLGAEELKHMRIPTYATLASFLGSRGGWLGWSPHYVKLNELDYQEFQRVLLQSAGLPGIFPCQAAMGIQSIDGGWCDNVPSAPLLFDDASEVDMLIVIYLDQAGRRSPQRLLPGLKREAPIVADKKTGLIVLPETAREYWTAHQNVIQFRADLNRPRETIIPNEIWDEVIKTERALKKHPRPTWDIPTIHVLPSKRMGGFLFGTLGFSKKRARRFMELGEADMNRIIAQLGASDEESDKVMTTEHVYEMVHLRR